MNFISAKESKNFANLKTFKDINNLKTWVWFGRRENGSSTKTSFWNVKTTNDHIIPKVVKPKHIFLLFIHKLNNLL